MITPGDLSEYGIRDVIDIVYNPSWNTLFAEETKPGISRSERGVITRSGAISVDSGSCTDLSPKDRYIVIDDTTRDSVWWRSNSSKASGNKPVSAEIWDHCKRISANQLSGKKLFVVDCCCGNRENARINIRYITEVAWQAHFVRNIFLRPEPDQPEKFRPDFVVLQASRATNDSWQAMGLNSGNFILLNLSEKMSVIGGTWYSGEVKKVILSVMNYFLTAKGIISLNCSANAGTNGDVALFFGLPGTGKTTLSTDPCRALLGDDEHGWDDEGIFSLEGGCYPICYRLNRDIEPEIFKAIRRDALLENLVIKSDGSIDFNDESRTENARVSYPLHHIDNILNAESKAGHPANVILLSKDTFGVLPPVSRLTEEQFKYYFLSGYSSRVALTERGLVEPVPLFSACFCAPFLVTDPEKYTEELAGRMRAHGTAAWLVNTGWICGSHGKGYRIDLPSTRIIINAILDGSIGEGGFNYLPIFNLSIPARVRGIDDKILDPANGWESRTKWHIVASDLALKFINNFSKFSSKPETSCLAGYGPGII